MLIIPSVLDEMSIYLNMFVIGPLCKYIEGKGGEGLKELEKREMGPRNKTCWCMKERNVCQQLREGHNRSDSWQREIGDKETRIMQQEEREGYIRGGG